jgi:hypothetical protein
VPVAECAVDDLVRALAKPGCRYARKRVEVARELLFELCLTSTLSNNASTERAAIAPRIASSGEASALSVKTWVERPC